ncbi:MAG: hypothetical protein C5B60_07940, partial [Chloroflexi bacterium]
MRHISGQWRDARGNLARNGDLHLKLNQDAMIPATSQTAPREVSFHLNEEGGLPAGSQVWANDEMLPTTTYYTATVTEQGGGLIWGPQNLVIVSQDPTDMTGKSIIDLNSIIPLPGIANLLPSAAVPAQTIVFTRPPLQAGVMNAEISSATTWSPSGFVTVSDQYVLAPGGNVSLIASKSMDSLTVTVSYSSIQSSFVAGSNIVIDESRNSTGVTFTFNAAELSLVAGSDITISTLSDSQGTTASLFGNSTSFLSLAPGSNITLNESRSSNSMTVTIEGPTDLPQYFYLHPDGGSVSGNTTMSGLTANFIAGSNITLSGNQAGSEMDLYVFGGSGGSMSLVEGSNVSITSTFNTLGTTATIAASAARARVDILSGPNITVSSTADQIGSTFALTAGGGGGGVLSFVSGPGITISSSSDTLGGATASFTGASFVGGISGGNTLGQSGTNSSRLVLAGGSNITLSGATNASGMTASIMAARLSVSQGSNVVVSTGSNSLGTTATINAQRLSLAAGDFPIVLSTATNASGTNATIRAIAGIHRVLVHEGDGPVIAWSSGPPAGTYTVNEVEWNVITNQSNRLIFFPGRNITMEAHSWPGSDDFDVIVHGRPQPAFGIRAIGGAQSGDGMGALIEAQSLFLRAGSGITLTGSSQFQSANTVTHYTVEFRGAAGSGSVFAGGNMTSSTSGSSTTLGAPLAGTLSSFAAFSAGLSNIGNTTGNTGVLSNRLVLAGGNAIMLSGATNAAGMTATISANLNFGIAASGGSSSGVTSANIAMFNMMAGSNVYLSATSSLLGTHTGYFVNINVPNIPGTVGIAVNQGTTGGTASMSGMNSLLLVAGSNISLHGMSIPAGATRAYQVHIAAPNAGVSRGMDIDLIDHSPMNNAVSGSGFLPDIRYLYYIIEGRNLSVTGDYFPVNATATSAGNYGDIFISAAAPAVTLWGEGPTGSVEGITGASDLRNLHLIAGENLTIRGDSGTDDGPNADQNYMDILLEGPDPGIQGFTLAATGGATSGATAVAAPTNLFLRAGSNITLSGAVSTQTQMAGAVRVSNYVDIRG